MSCCCDEERFFDADEDDYFGLWVGKLVSVEERRRRFGEWMGLDSETDLKFNSVVGGDELAVDFERIASGSEAQVKSDVNSSVDTNGFVNADKVHDGCTLRTPFEDNSYKIESSEKSRIITDTSFSDRSFTQKEDGSSAASTSSDDDVIVSRGRKNGWLKKLGISSLGRGRQGKNVKSMPKESTKSGRVKVHPYRKKFKEFSAVYRGQDIEAHKGAIRTMKFSPDGQYLASGGEDGVVRVWHVKETDWTGEEDFVEDDPSCMYFRANDKFHLKPIYMEKERKNRSKDTGNLSHSSCVILPPEVFRISEKPVHEFHGHTGDILDLAWSKNKCLLSSSTDKTVRLWQVGRGNCIKVFSHNDYVTCVQYNPVDEKYFMSGSIDGKVRIWEISCCRVVDWIDIKEIVSAACYQPDGKVIVIGLMNGNCRFYGFSDSNLQLQAQISLPGKKKYPSKRITGFQFSPTRPEKLMVSSADSQITILDKFEVTSKYKGLRNAGSQISASFTSDGRHIVSASEYSNVYVWNHVDPDVPSPTTSHVKSSWSSEHFFSSNVSVAIPWTQSSNHSQAIPAAFASQQGVFRDFIRKHESHLQCNVISGGYKSGQRFFSEFLSRGSATWPEEKLTEFSTTSESSLFESEYKVLEPCNSDAVTPPHAWGQVIVTAGLDGRIKSYCNYGLPVQV